jgi:hypothetical protein
LLRGRLAGQVGAREEELAEGMRKAGVNAHRITTDQDMLAALVDMVRRSGRAASSPSKGGGGAVGSGKRR